MGVEVIHNQLTSLLQKIRAAEIKHHRTPGSVFLLAVSKKQSVEKIREAFNAGQKNFGENYLQEALEKQNALRDLTIEWHFIGTIQSNKTKLIAENFDWVHSVNKLSIAKKLNSYRSAHLKPLNVCIEINIDAETTKSGANAESIFELSQHIAALKHLKLRGLMIIPQKSSNDAFQKTAELQQQLIRKGFLLDTLSMGMSGDFEAAIAAGSTFVRIGTAIFGKRDSSILT